MHRIPEPSRRRRRWLLVPVAAAVTVAALAAPRPAEDVAVPRFGVLGSSCAPDRLAAERAAGVTVVELDLAWDRLEPAPGVVDPAEAERLRGQLAACREAGVAVVLSLGLQYPPAWVRQLGTLTDQYGGAPATGADLVFSPAVRQAVAEHAAVVGRETGFAGVTAVRVGTDATGELAYPGPDEGAGAHSWWAFGAGATGPLPGWVPGETTWRGAPVTAEQADAWFSWYTGALVDAVAGQVEALRAAGFTGRFQLPLAGTGVLPGQRRAAVAGLLDPALDPDGDLARGLDHPASLAAVAELDRRLQAAGSGVDVDATGVDDVSAVRARRQQPPTDGCAPDDAEAVAAGAEGTGWSSTRWVAANARANGLRVHGENPGPPGAPHTGGSAESDSLAQQLPAAVRYATDCGLDLFLLAFEDQLFTAGSGVGLDDYARTIRSAGEDR